MRLFKSNKVVSGVFMPCLMTLSTLHASEEISSYQKKSKKS